MIKRCVVCGGRFETRYGALSCSPEHRREWGSKKRQERNRKYYAANREKLLENGKKYVAANRERVSKYQQKYRVNNREALRENRRKYFEANHERVLGMQRQNSRKKQELIAFAKQVLADTGVSL